MDPALAAHLNKALRGVSRDIGGPTRYDTVHAILIRWEEDYLNLQSKLDELDLVFQNYGFSTVVWLIPSFCAYFYLMDKAEELIEAKDSDRNLFILYYAGHGRVDRERHVVWSRTEDVWPVSVDSFEFQGLFANSTSDILNLFDSVAPTLATVKKSQNQVIETIAARGYNSSGYEMVDFSFTETLVEVLSDRITKGPFSVSMLHAELINRMLSRRSKGEWRRTPVHTVSHWTLKRRGGIELYRLQTLPPLAAPGSKSESNAQARLPASRTLFLNISLGNPLKHVDSAPWISWIRGYSPPNVHGVEFVSSQNPSLFSTPSFGLRVWLRDSFIPGSSAWLRWIEHIPGEVHAITVDIEKEDTPSDEDDIATFVAHLNLNAGVTDALRRNYYQKATVLPIMWGTPASNQIDVDYTKLYAERNDIQKELSDIGDVFKSRFNFNVEPIWEIPDDKPNCQQALNKKIQKLADEYDDGDALVIVLYGGHGADSRRKTSGYYNTSQETHCIWIANPSSYSAEVDWTKAQMRIEDASCDSLMILDCCHAGNASRSLSRSTNEILAASVPEASSYSGARAYSKMLKKKLETLPLLFTALQLHEEMVKERNKPMSQNPDSLIATPSHGYAGNGGGRTVILRPLKHLHMIDDSDPSPSGVTPETVVPTNPRIFMEIELDQSQQLDVVKWEAWFAERPPPPSMFGVKFYTKEEVHVKVITENAVFTRTADDGLVRIYAEP